MPTQRIPHPMFNIWHHHKKAPQEGTPGWEATVHGPFRGSHSMDQSLGWHVTQAAYCNGLYHLATSMLFALSLVLFGMVVSIMSFQHPM